MILKRARKNCISQSHVFSRTKSRERISDYFLFFLPGFFAVGAGFADGGAAFATGAVTFPAGAFGFATTFAAFLSLPFVSFGFGYSLIPESFRKIFSRSSGVLPLPVNCIAKTCCTIASNFCPAGIPIAVNSLATAVTPCRIGLHLFRYARIFETAPELEENASK